MKKQHLHTDSNKLTKIQAEIDKYKYKPRVAVMNLIFNSEKKVLLVRRNKNKTDALNGQWGGVGGKIEYLESARNAAIREAFEEIGLKPHNPRFVGVTENILEYPHYVVLWFAEISPANSKIHLDVSENAEFGFFPISSLPLPIDERTKTMIKRAWRILTYEAFCT